MAPSFTLAFALSGLLAVPPGRGRPEREKFKPGKGAQPGNGIGKEGNPDFSDGEKAQSCVSSGESRSLPPHPVVQHSMKELLFDSEANPSIQWIRDICFWVASHTPDLTMLEGWRKAVMWVFYIMLILGTGAWVLESGFTLPNLIIKGLILTLIIGIINANFISMAILSFLVVWETFK